MKNTTRPENTEPPARGGTATVSRYQIYRQTHTGSYTVPFKTDSAVEAVESFLNQSPAFEGGELRIWNHREQRVSASVEWNMEKTDFGFLVFNRTNVFHDRLLGLIARQVQERESMRESLRHEAGMSLAV